MENRKEIKNTLPVYLGVAFVWFTTQFGGGFASGAQVYSYFIQYGWCAVFTPIMAQLLQAIVFYYVFCYAFKYNLFNYRKFTDHFYGSTKNVMSNAYEVVYNVTICLATAIAFATGGSTLKELTGMPYMLCTLIIGVFIFILTIFGSSLVRKAATSISVLIIAGVLIVFIPNIIAQWGEITANIGNLKATGTPTDILQGMWQAVLYGAFQIAAIGVYIGHTDAFKSKNEIKKSIVAGFGINTVIIMLAVFGLFAIPIESFATSTVPTLTLVQNGVGASLLTPIISVLILLGSVSTGVNMIYGIVNRIVPALGKKETKEVSDAKEKVRTYVTSALYILLTFSIAQFGLIPLVKKGYGYLGYITLIVVVVPVIIHAILDKKRK